jgi:hypothetical protein
MKSHNTIHLSQIGLLLCFAASLGGPLADCTAQSNGTVVAWGNNSSGQANVPMGLSNAVMVAAGGKHSLALRSDGTVTAWGVNSAGQTNVPASLTNVVAIAGGGFHSMALKSDGTVVAWGNDAYGQVSGAADVRNATAIAAGNAHSLALKSDGTVVAWGPRPNYYVPAGLSNVIAIAAGAYHSMALKSSGTVVAWGDSSYGKTNVPAGSSNVVAIAAGGQYSMALKSDGTAVAWGYDSYGQVSGAADVRNATAIAAGNAHGLALKSDGTVVAWGANYYGQTNVPPGLSNVVAIGAGGSSEHSSAVCGGLLSMIAVPSNQVVAAGWAAEFRVVVLGIPPLSYRWFFGGMNFIPGATNAVLHLDNVQPSQSGPYTVIVTNAYGSLTSSPALLSVVGVPPSITKQPTNQASWAGFPVDFSAQASGSLPLAFQWLFNETNVLVGATNSTLHLTNVQPWQAGAYRVVVTNAYGAITSSPAVLSLVPSNTVFAASETLLRAAIASGAGSVMFAFDGTITLGSTITITTTTVLDGTGHQVAISGNGVSQVFRVNTNVTLTLVALTIADGRSDFGGGGIYNDGGTLVLQNCVFANNSVCGYCELLYDSSSNSWGGAIYNCGTLSASRCAFLTNSATGANGPYGHSAYPPIGPGEAGGNGGAAYGGAIYSVGTMSIESSLFTGNTASGGRGGGGGTSVNSPPNSGHGAPGGAGGSANGAIFNGGTATLVNCTFASNVATGGVGGPGGDAESDHGGPFGPGGSGGDGGAGFAGICDVTGHLSMTNCTVALNRGYAGNGGRGGGGSPGGSDGGNGAAGGGISTLGARLVSTLLATNAPGSNCSGTITDAGHNLSSDASCAFTSTGSLNNTDPKLGPLADNGGPTLTLALLAGSPAIDAGDSAAAPATDQRGMARPVGPTPDIGAFEYGLPAVLRVSGSQGTGLDLLVSAYPGLPCRLLTSISFSNWLPMATNQIGSDGTVLFHDDWVPSGACRLYRLVMP